MLEKITDVPPGIDALKAVGKLSKDDYEKSSSRCSTKLGSKVGASDS